MRVKSRKSPHSRWNSLRSNRFYILKNRGVRCQETWKKIEAARNGAVFDIEIVGSKIRAK